MGSVDLAVRREGAFERLFAVKRLRPELVHEREIRAMFLEEARLAGRVRHPNVVAVVDLGEDEQGPFLVMDYVEGVSAAELIASCRGEAPPLEVCLRIARDVALGLHAAHELAADDGTPLGLVHRDVSPQNVLVGFDGVARVTDFGIAKALGRTTATSTGILKGKLAYMAPEQLRFEAPDRRADLFALGVVLFELCTGVRLYKSEGDLDGARRILNEPPPDLGDHREDAEPELVELLLELLAKDPELRPKTAKDVARRLDAVLSTVSSGADPVDVGEFVSTRFAGLREERQRELASALERTRRGESNAGSTASGVEMGPKGRARPSRAVLVAAVVALAAAAVAAISLRRTAIDVPRTGNQAGRTMADDAPVTATPVAKPVTTSPSAEPSAPASAAMAPPSIATAGSAEAPQAATAAKTHRASRAPAHKPGGVPLWESY
jgi:serine/threonine-protein kinase